MNVAVQRLILIMAVLFFSGCAVGGNHGTLLRNRELDKMFLSYQVIPDHRYYTSGGYDRPNAILGLHKDYQLDNDLWQSIPNVDSAQIEKWIRTIDPQDRGVGHNYFAYYILDPDGKRVGFWYSIQNFAVIKFFEEKRIQVYTPDLIQPGDRSGDGDRTPIKLW